MSQRTQSQDGDGLEPVANSYHAKVQAQAASRLYAAMPADGRQLHVVLVTPSIAPAWISTMLELAAESRHVAFSVVQIEAQPLVSATKLPLGLRAFLNVERWLLRCFLRMTGRQGNSPMAPTRIAMGGRTDTAQQAASSDLDSLRQRVQALQPDLVILHGSPQWALPLAACAAHGCWFLDESLVAPARAGVALLEPILGKQDASAITLQLQVEGTVPVTLAQSWGATRAISFSQHRDQAFAKLPAMLLRSLRKLGNTPHPGLQGVVARLGVAPPDRPFVSGAGFKALGITFWLMRHWRRRRYRARQPWFVVLREEGEVIDPTAPRIGRVRSLVAPGADYWADPFPFSHAGRQWLFVEEFIAATSKGVIRLLELLPDGNVVRHGIVLEEPFHLSFPQIWNGQGEWWMTVESADGGKVSLYRSDDPFGGWRCVSNLIQGRECVDPTLFEHQGHWYLFVNVAESGGNPSDELFLFTADQMEGPYQPHPANPIVCDVRRARMAGRVFVDAQGRLIRPAQCCAPIYGTALVFNQIIELSPQTYVERTLSRLDADWALELDGCHTYYRDGVLEVLDAHGKPPPADMRARLVAPDGAIVHS